MPEFNPGNVLIYLYQLLGWWLGTLGIPAPIVVLIQLLVSIISVGAFALLLPIFTIWLERKVAGRFQDRLGPNRVGPYGLFQSFADVFKLLTKEDITPAGADKVVFDLAPMLTVLSVVTIWAVVPFASSMVGANINVGVLYIVAISGLGTISIMMGGWSSNNKFALLGAFRTAAQLVAYEVPMIIVLLVPVMLAGSMGVQDIVNAQGTAWFIVMAPVAGLIFFITSIAEIGRAPFDLLEAESEIVAGFHIEYTGMKFGMWMLGEFLHAFTICVLTAVLFLGGWQGPFAKEVPVLGIVYFLLKSFGMYFIVIWVRSTFPRIRIDHLHAFNWKVLVPVSLAAVVLTALVDKLVTTYLPGAGDVVRATALLAANVIVVLALLGIFRQGAHAERERLEGGRDASHGEAAHHDEPGEPGAAHASAH
ncbi:MAG: NADH-quinone oxidoreductase subunit NuoH [Chloroflexi bacterium]|nr:NADH-quinone oxidoreductase subunit NuoH [Chloroflexota bacterium]